MSVYELLAAHPEAPDGLARFGVVYVEERPVVRRRSVEDGAVARCVVEPRVSIGPNESGYVTRVGWDVPARRIFVWSVLAEPRGTRNEPDGTS